MDAPKPTEIPNPRRMLVVGAPDSGVLEFLTDLTATAPPQPRPTDSPADGDDDNNDGRAPSTAVGADDADGAGPSTAASAPPAPTASTATTTAGLTHAWPVATAYYTTTVPIWIDEIVRLDEWRADFCRPEAREVVAAVGAWVYVFRKPAPSSSAAARGGGGGGGGSDRDRVLQTMEAVQKVIEKGAGLACDGVCLAVGVKSEAAGMVGTSEAVVADAGRNGGADGEGWGLEEWEDAARERGFEYVDAEMKGRNEFGELQGMARVKEALEANEWEGDGDGLSDFEDLDGEGSGDEDWGKTFAAEEAEMGMELLGLKTELNGGADDADGEDQAAQVDELERMMSKLSGIKDLAAGMPEEQKKKFAAKAMNDLMKSA